MGRDQLKESLERWLEADLVSTDQVDKIIAFETRRHAQLGAGRAARAVAMLGVLTVVCGVGSLVAYNWEKLGPGFKLSGMGLLLVGCASAVLWAAQRREKHPAALDVASLLLAGLTLFGLGLVSQIYDQDGELHHLATAWCLLSLPAFLLTTSRIASTLFYLSILVVTWSWGDDLSQWLPRTLGFDYQARDATTALVLGSLTAILGARFVASDLPERQGVGRIALWTHLMTLGLLADISLEESGDGAPIFWLAVLVALGAVVASLPKEVTSLGFGRRRFVIALVALGLAGLGFGLGLAVDSPIAGFVAFMSFFGLAWYLAERAGSLVNARFCVFAIAVRIVVASFQLFENLLVTGSVLVAFGLGALFWTRRGWLSKSAPVEGTK